MIAEYAPYVMAGILIAAMLIELRTGKIPNWLTLLPFVLFIIAAATLPDRSALIWQLGIAAGVFAVGLLLFAFAGFGAGAVKLMTGLALFVPLSQGWQALGIFAGALIVMTIIIVLIRKAVGSEESKWNVLSSRTLPMSVPLTVAGLLVFFA